MDDYNFWSDLLDTWQSTADWIKALAILTPPATALAALALVLRHRQARRRAATLPAGTLAYTIWRDEDDRLRVLRHDVFIPSALAGEARPEGVKWESGPTATRHPVSPKRGRPPDCHSAWGELDR